MRALMLFAVAVVLLTVQSTLHTLVPTKVPVPALAAMAPLYVAFAPGWTVTRALVLGFLVGYVFDLLSGSPLGVHALAMSLLVLVACLLGTRLQVRAALARIVMGFGLTLVFGGLVLACSRLAGSPAPGRVGLLLLEATLSAAVAPPIFALFERIEQRFDPTAVRARASRHRLANGIELRR